MTMTICLFQRYILVVLRGQTTFSVFICGSGKRSGCLTIDFVLLNPYRFWGALIADDKLEKTCLMSGMVNYVLV